MQVRMSVPELTLYKAFLSRTDNYVEFGSGGSTFLAASLVKKSVTTVDSSTEWLASVEKHCVEKQTPTKPVLTYADIGPTGDWGYPLDQSKRDAWPSYYQNIWDNAGAADADLVLVDGRFRVACFLTSLLRVRPGAILLFHDFESRPQYHIVRTLCREFAMVEDLSAFQIDAHFDRDKIEKLLLEYGYNSQ